MHIYVQTRLLPLLSLLLFWFPCSRQEILDDNPHVLGAIRWKGDLPFLFKVISISKALSIQAHPDKVCTHKQLSLLCLCHPTSSECCEPFGSVLSSSVFDSFLHGCFESRS